MHDITSYEKELRAEEAALQKELSTLGRKNPSGEHDWELTEPDLDINPSDRNEAADQLEELEENSAILNSMEDRLAEVAMALERVKDGTFGVCEVCGKTIEEERLHANACARTCIEHKDGVHPA